MSYPITPSKKRGNPLMQRGGPSLNPAGRPARSEAIAQKVRDATDGSDLVAMLMFLAKDPTTKPADRIHAIKALLDRGWGQPVAISEIEATIAGDTTLPHGWGAMTRDERAAWLATAFAHKGRS